jgi:hypothetical protein
VGRLDFLRTQVYPEFVPPRGFFSTYSTGAAPTVIPKPYKTNKLAFLFSRALPVALAIVLLGALTACHRAKPETETANPTATPAGGGDEATNAIPPDLYPGTPIYPGSVVEHVHKPKGDMREIQFKIANAPPLQKLIAFYKDGLKNNNFSITSTLTMAVRKTWSCDFQKQSRPGSIALYPDDKDKSAMEVDLIYELPSKMDASLLEPVENFDVVGPGKVASNAPTTEKRKNKRN